ncbi:hypothetical protein O181_022237 [Austropuccinia psidii MF-1]|uniref:Uncharacterized protein n=1 Tax=Austropuccinia psidii MF-1 TaxID=1389203 RepID=A0A9Q3CH36_9BASI|nr:hypothetical protein [Austropuccinia psidii MF-1]
MGPIEDGLWLRAWSLGRWASWAHNFHIQFGAYIKEWWQECGCTNMTAGSAANYATFGGPRLTLAYSKAYLPQVNFCTGTYWEKLVVSKDNLTVGMLLCGQGGMCGMIKGGAGSGL